jgi:cell division protease FtsH
VADKNDFRPTPKPEGPNPQRSRTSIVYLLLTVALFGYLAYTMSGTLSGQSPTVTLATSEFVAAVKADHVDKVTYQASSGDITGTYWTDDASVGNDSEAVQFKSTYVGSDSLADLMSRHPLGHLHGRHHVERHLDHDPGLGGARRCCSSASCCTS